MKTLKAPYLNIKKLSSSSSVDSYIALISPAIAEKLLQKNSFNRKLSRPLVARYAGIMRAGEWSIGEALTFDTSGQLLNGQHRLQAVIAANIDVAFLVTTGMPCEARFYYDLGKKRTASDIAAIANKHLPTRDVALVRAMSLGRSKESTATVHRVVDLCELYRPAIDFASKIFGSGNSLFRRAAFRAPVAKAYYYENHQRLIEFLTILDTGLPVSGSDPDADSACFALREAYHRADKDVRRKSRITWFKRTEKALHNFCLRKVSKHCREAEASLYPLPDFDNTNDSRIVRRIKQANLDFDWRKTS